jgi:hypothetical protein
MIIFDKIIDIIIKERKEICIKVQSTNEQIFIPKIYYIGMGKTGSTSLAIGFQNVNVAHWHSTRYFENLFRAVRILNADFRVYMSLIFYILLMF